MDVGAYYKIGDEIKTLKLADYQVITDKKRKAIAALSPVPLIPGKASVVIQGEHSSFSVNEERPSFFMRLSKEERFGIIKAVPKKRVRVVEDISIIPVAKETVENMKQVDVFQQQLATGLYRVWPEKPLSPGEYALVEYGDSAEKKEDIELLVWDFAVSAPK